KIEYRFAFVSSSSMPAFASACCLDVGEGGLVDGAGVFPAVEAGGDPFVDAVGDLLGFIAGQRLMEAGVDFVDVGADNVVKLSGILSGGVLVTQPDSAGFAVGPGAGGFKDIAVAA